MKYLSTLFIFLTGTLAGVMLSVLSAPEPLQVVPNQISSTVVADKPSGFDPLCRTAENAQTQTSSASSAAEIACLRRELMARNVQLVKMAKLSKLAKL